MSYFDPKYFTKKNRTIRLVTRKLENKFFNKNIIIKKEGIYKLNFEFH